MNEIDDIIKLLEEDAELEVVEYIEKNRDKLEESPFYNWHDDRNRRLLLTSAGISNEVSLVIRQYPIGF